MAAYKKGKLRHRQYENTERTPEAQKELGERHRIGFSLDALARAATP